MAMTMTTLPLSTLSVGMVVLGVPGIVSMVFACSSLMSSRRGTCSFGVGAVRIGQQSGLFVGRGRAALVMDCLVFLLVGFFIKLARFDYLTTSKYRMAENMIG